MALDWPFDQAPNVVCITTRQVLREGYPILVVTHYDDDHSWGFTCGTTDDPADGLCLCMESALGLDPTLATIADLEPGWRAWREDVGGEWHRGRSEFPNEDE